MKQIKPQVEDIDSSLHDLPEEPPKTPEVKVEYKPLPPIKKDGFDEPDDLVTTAITYEYQSKRQRDSYNKRQEEMLEEKKNKKPKETTVYSFEDDVFDTKKGFYKKLGLKPNIFTYPANLERTITSETPIACILKNRINSQNPGNVYLSVDEDLLDPTTMQNILLPATTTIVCKYTGLTQTGQTRLALNCFLIRRPDGATARLSSAKVADMSGASGLIGIVDNRIWQMYGSAFLVSSISALAQVSEEQISNQAASRGVGRLSEPLNQSVSKYLDKNIDVRPVMTIEAGTRIILQLEYDLLFPKPQTNTINEELENAVYYNN